MLIKLINSNPFYPSSYHLHFDDFLLNTAAAAQLEQKYLELKTMTYF